MKRRCKWRQEEEEEEEEEAKAPKGMKGVVAGVCPSSSTRACATKTRKAFPSHAHHLYLDENVEVRKHLRGRGQPLP